jgi:hypothetical protein
MFGEIFSKYRRKIFDPVNEKIILGHSTNYLD